MCIFPRQKFEETKTVITSKTEIESKKILPHNSNWKAENDSMESA